MWWCCPVNTVAAWSNYKLFPMTLDTHGGAATCVSYSWSPRRGAACSSSTWGGQGTETSTWTASHLWRVSNAPFDKQTHTHTHKHTLKLLATNKVKNKRINLLPQCVELLTRFYLFVRKQSDKSNHERLITTLLDWGEHWGNYLESPMERKKEKENIAFVTCSLSIISSG